MNYYHYNEISVAQWVEILQDRTIVTKELEMIIAILYGMPEYKLNAKAISEILGYLPFQRLNVIVGTFGRKIKENYEIPQADILNWHGHWVVVFDGDTEQKNKFNWILKPNMIAALAQLDLLQRQSEIIRTTYELDSVNALIEEQKLTGDVRRALTKIRIGQGKFRTQLLQHYAGTCCLCGLNIEQLLIASHIKPWAASTPEEKGDLHNGLLLCAGHDALFDKFLISFTAEGKILISANIEPHTYHLLNLDENMHIALTKEMKGYMHIHRQTFKHKNAETV